MERIEERFKSYEVEAARVKAEEEDAEAENEATEEEIDVK